MAFSLSFSLPSHNLAWDPNLSISTTHPKFISDLLPLCQIPWPLLILGTNPLFLKPSDFPDILLSLDFKYIKIS